MMTAVPARAAFPVLAILIVAALAGWYVLSGRRPVAPPDRPQIAGQAPPPAGGPASPPASPGVANRAEPLNRSDGSPASRPGNEATAQPPQPAATGEPSARAAADPRSDERARADERARPSFDVVRVEPTGDSVIAGRAAPGATIDLLRNGEPLARAVADASGLFALVPPPLAPGPHEITLQAIEPDGARVRSGQSVTVVIADRRDKSPLVTVTTPDQPTVVLSRPEEPRLESTPAQPQASGRTATAATDRESASLPPVRGPAQPQLSAGAPRAPVRVAVVESESEGRLFVSGQAAPGATVRLYLNDAFVAPGGTGPDGRLSFTIERGIRPGDYRVRLDDVDPVTGAVKSRAEVAFNVPPSPSRAPAPVVASNTPPAAVPPGPAAADPGAPSAGRREPSRPEAPAAEQPPQTVRGAAVPAPFLSPPPTPATPPPAVVAAAPRTAPVPGTVPPPAASGQPTAAQPTAATARPETQPSAPAVATAPLRPEPSVRGGAVQGTAAYTSATDPGQVIVPEVNTAIVARGDNLWRISKRVYGRGLRYTVIFDANTPQIRNPDLIYPGQVFVLPSAQ